jgi:hypothetical protein
LDNLILILFSTNLLTMNKPRWDKTAEDKLTTHKLLKKSQGTLCPGGSISIFQPSCCFALVRPSLGSY